MHFVALGVDWEAKLGRCLNTAASAGGENEGRREQKGKKFSLHSS